MMRPPNVAGLDEDALISGQTLALAHLLILAGLMAAAGVSAYRARNGVRVGRRGDRYRRLTTRQMLRRLDSPPDGFPGGPPRVQRSR